MRKFLLHFFVICTFAMHCNAMNLPDVIELPVPGMPVETVNIKEIKINEAETLPATIDVIEKKPLSQIIENQFKNAPGYIIARIGLRYGGQDYKSYYDVGNLNPYLFGDWRLERILYPASSTGILGKKDPKTNLDINNWTNVNYFYGAQPNQTRLTYLGSAQDLMPVTVYTASGPQHSITPQAEYMRNLFTALYHQNPETRRTAQRLLNLQPVSIVVGKTTEELVQELEQAYEVFKKQPTDTHYQAFKAIWDAHKDAQFKDDEDAERMNKFVDAIREHLSTKTTPAAMEAELSSRKKRVQRFRDIFQKVQSAQGKDAQLKQIVQNIGDVQYVNTEERNKILDDFILVARKYLDESNRPQAIDVVKRAFEKIKSWLLYPLDEQRISQLEILLQDLDPNQLKTFKAEQKELQQKVQQEPLEAQRLEEQRKREEDFRKKQEEQQKKIEELRKKQEQERLAAEKKRLAGMTPQAQRLYTALKKLSQALNALEEQLHELHMASVRFWTE